jgi:prevent-host-death family protein
LIRENDYYDHNELNWGTTRMSIHTWTVAEAKAKFSELLDKANSEGPQKITKHGRTTAVVVAAEEWERKAERKGNLAEFLASSPLRGSGLKIRRLPMRLRKVEL